MQTLPDNIRPYKKTPVFTQDSIPAGLRKAHNTKAGTWGSIVIVRGQLLYRILEPAVEEVLLNSNRYGVVEPEVLHEVQAIGEVEFYVEFYR